MTGEQKVGWIYGRFASGPSRLPMTTLFKRPTFGGHYIAGNHQREGSKWVKRKEIIFYLHNFTISFQQVQGNVPREKQQNETITLFIVRQFHVMLRETVLVPSSLFAVQTAPLMSVLYIIGS